MSVILDTYTKEANGFFNSDRTLNTEVLDSFYIKNNAIKNDMQITLDKAKIELKPLDVYKKRKTFDALSIININDIHNPEDKNNYFKNEFNKSIGFFGRVAAGLNKITFNFFDWISGGYIPSLKTQAISFITDKLKTSTAFRKKINSSIHKDRAFSLNKRNLAKMIKKSESEYNLAYNDFIMGKNDLTKKYKPSLSALNNSLTEIDGIIQSNNNDFRLYFESIMEDKLEGKLGKKIKVTAVDDDQNAKMLISENDIIVYPTFYDEMTSKNTYTMMQHDIDVFKPLPTMGEGVVIGGIKKSYSKKEAAPIINKAFHDTSKELSVYHDNFKGLVKYKTDFAKLYSEVDKLTNQLNYFQK